MSDANVPVTPVTLTATWRRWFIGTMSTGEYAFSACADLLRMAGPVDERLLVNLPDPELVSENAGEYRVGADGHRLL